jgi:hypothetical protein
LDAQPAQEASSVKRLTSSRVCMKIPFRVGFYNMGIILHGFMLHILGALGGKETRKIF